MKLIEYKKRPAKYTALRVSKREAATLIASLATQLRNDNPNTGREETLLDTEKSSTLVRFSAGYFSIFVVDEP